MSAYIRTGKWYDGGDQRGLLWMIKTRMWKELVNWLWEDDRELETCGMRGHFRYNLPLFSDWWQHNQSKQDELQEYEIDTNLKS